jgi:hypothetical protein
MSKSLAHIYKANCPIAVFPLILANPPHMGDLRMFAGPRQPGQLLGEALIDQKRGLAAIVRTGILIGTTSSLLVTLVTERGFRFTRPAKK